MCAGRQHEQHVRCECPLLSLGNHPFARVVKVGSGSNLRVPGEGREGPVSAKAANRRTLANWVNLLHTVVIESIFDVGRRFRCTMRVDCGELDPRAVIRQVPGEWHPHMPQRLDEEELADWRAGRNAVYQLAALTIGARLGVADA